MRYRVVAIREQNKRTQFRIEEVYEGVEARSIFAAPDAPSYATQSDAIAAEITKIEAEMARLDSALGRATDEVVKLENMADDYDIEEGE